jgi:2,4-dienoyl-CoA reductase (NADPH2)
VSTIVVTGGATGIGLAIAHALHRDGHALVLASRSEERLRRAQAALRQEGASCDVAVLDVRDHESVAALFRTLPAVDGLVNNAAGNFACATVDLTPNGFRAVVEISLFGCFHCSQALARRLLDEGRPGAILNIVATYAWTGAPGVAHSAAAKAGMVAFTRSVAREWGPAGIRVNALAPGFVPTENAVRGLLEHEAAQARMRSLIPLGRFGDAGEVADVAAFLLSDRASYVTGTVVTADGGRSLGLSLHDVAGQPE